MNTSLVGLWQTMGWFPRAIVFVMFIMAIFIIAVTVTKWSRFYRMGKATRKFAPEFSSILERGSITEGLALADQYRQKSHVAQVLGEALREVAPLIDGGGPVSEAAIDMAERTIEREQVLLANDMKSGLGVLATIGATAPFVGLLGTTMGVIDAFTGMAQQGGGIAAISAGIAEALITTAVGLLVAIPAVWLYNYFNTRLGTLFSELSYASRELTDWMRSRSTRILREESRVESSE